MLTAIGLSLTVCFAVLCCVSVRSHRDYHTLGPTQRYTRRKLATARISSALDEIDVPLSALHLSSKAPPAQFIHLSQSERERIRTVPALRPLVPGEAAVTALKLQLAVTHAAATADFPGGAFICDPLRYVAVLTAASPFVVIGGDTGGGLTKLGVTYLDCSAKQRFAALLVYRGKDNAAALHALTAAKAPGLMPFTGDSANCADIFAVLQRLIDERIPRC